MANPDGKRVKIARKDVYEIKVGDKESLQLSEDEALNLLDNLEKALGTEETAPSGAAPEEIQQPSSRAAKPSGSVPPRRKKSAPSTPAQRRRQTVVMSGIVVIVIAAAFVAFNLQTGPGTTAFQPPATPYEHFYITAETTLRFNGTSPGPSLTAPNNTNVWVTFTVASNSQEYHSWVLVPGNTSTSATLPIPPVFPNATSPSPSIGSKPGQTDQIVFKVTQIGTYKYICEVPGHFDAGMYGYLNVTSSNTTSNATALISVSSPQNLQAPNTTHLSAAQIQAVFRSAAPTVLSRMIG